MKKPQLPTLSFDLNRLFFLFLRCTLSIIMGTVTFIEIVKLFVPDALSTELIIFVTLFDIVMGILFILSDYFLIVLIAPAVLTLGMLIINIMGFVSAVKEIYFGLLYGNQSYMSGETNIVPYSGEYTSWLGFAALFSLICFYVIMVSYLGSRPLLGTMPFWFLIVSCCLVGQFPDLSVILIVACSTALNMILNNHHGKGLNLSALVSGSAITAICALLAVFVFLPSAAEFAHEHSDWLRALQQSIFESRSLDPLRDDLSTTKLENTPITHTGDTELTIQSTDIPSSTLYLKGMSAANYTGNSWKIASSKNLLKYISEESEAFNLGYYVLDSNSSMDGVNQLKYTISHESDTLGYAYVPENSHINSDDNTKGDAYITRETNSYSFVAYQPVDKFSLYNTLESNSLTTWAADTYMDTAGFEKNSEFTDMLSDAQNLSFNEKIDFVKNLLYNNYTYSNDITELDSGTDYVDNFLFSQKKGYCQHFASAATLMYRYLGIPARYCIGYMVDTSEFNSADEELYVAEVSDYDTHAWVEVFSEELGWVTVDVTPSNFREAYFGENSQEDNQDNETDEATPEPTATPTPTPEPEDEEIDPDMNEEATPTPEPTPEVDNIPENDNDNNNSNHSSGFGKAILVVLIIALLVGAYFAAKKTRDSSRFKITRKKPVQVLLLYMMGLIELCFGHRTNETDREYLSRVLKGLISEDDISTLSGYFEEAAFSSGKFSDNNGASTLCKTVRDAVLNTQKPFKRFVIVYILLK